VLGGIALATELDEPIEFRYEFVSLFSQLFWNNRILSQFLQIAAKSLRTITSTAFFDWFEVIFASGSETLNPPGVLISLILAVDSSS
jgi:hypothetical protein